MTWRYPDDASYELVNEADGWYLVLICDGRPTMQTGPFKYKADPLDFLVWLLAEGGKVRRSGRITMGLPQLRAQGVTWLEEQEQRLHQPDNTDLDFNDKAEAGGEMFPLDRVRKRARTRRDLTQAVREFEKKHGPAEPPFTA